MSTPTFDMTQPSAVAGDAVFRTDLWLHIRGPQAQMNTPTEFERDAYEIKGALPLK